MQPTISLQEMYQIVYQEHRDPFQVLGMHKLSWQGKTHVVARCFLPKAREAVIVSLSDHKTYAMKRFHPDGFYEVVCADKSEVFPYQIQIVDHSGRSDIFYDSYAFLPGLGDLDLYFLREGSHYRSFEKLGAHITTNNGVAGVLFAVWAPNARSVSVIGSFNGWDRRFHMMRMLGDSGVWELFIPGLAQGIAYKYQLRTNDNYILDKADPYGFCAELSPQTASIVYDIERYVWHDRQWLTERAQKQSLRSPMSVYEVHLGSWTRSPHHPEKFLGYRELAAQIVSYVKQMGYTHIELLPVQEHPFYGSWGYQVIGHYAPSSRYGTPDDFMYFVDYCHQEGIGVILDWVPAHFPKDGHGLAFFDGTHLYEHDDPRQRDHKDWNTYVYNYGRYEVKNFLISNALFWLEKYHLDGLRMDAVASMLHLDYSRKPGEWLPNKYGGRENLDAVAFLQELNARVHEFHPGVVTIAEESTSWPKVSGPIYLGGLGFDYKWNMGWMNDMLSYMAMDPICRKYYQQMLTFAIWYAWSENFMLPLSHDEVVYGKYSLINKMPGSDELKFANLRLLYGFMFAHPGKKLLFMGNDFAQGREWNHDQGLDWHLLRYQEHKQLQDYVRALNLFYQAHPAMYELDYTSQGFAWVDFRDSDHSVIAFWRKGKEEELLFVLNFTPVVWRDYRLGLDTPGRHLEIFNSDAEIYGGSNIGNMGEAMSLEEPWHDKPCHMRLTLPPLGMLVLQPEKVEKPKEDKPKTGEMSGAEKPKDETAKTAETVSTENKPKDATAKTVETGEAAGGDKKPKAKQP
jgi:1,4-alpha-glucan branching enzyme